MLSSAHLLLFSPESGLVLFAADLFHPVGGLAVEIFLNGNVCHGCGWRGAMPMFLNRRDQDHITRSNFLNRVAPALHPAAASRHDQGLSQRMSVPAVRAPGSNVTLNCNWQAGRASPSIPSRRLRRITSLPTPPYNGGRHAQTRGVSSQGQSLVMSCRGQANTNAPRFACQSTIQLLRSAYASW